MKVIIKPAGKIIKTWGEPDISEEEYRLITFHILTDCDEGTLLHNNVTGEMLLLDKEEAKLLGSLPKKYDGSEVFSYLVKKHFLVPVGFDEVKSVTQLRKVLRVIEKPKSIKSFTVLPTTACNARCFYCYEAGYPHFTMSEETAQKTVDYIDKYRDKEKTVLLSWFGGEPLLGAKRITQICNELKNRNIPYNSTMISNGYLFTKELSKEAKEVWRLFDLQITLDGTEEIYNKTKAYVGVKDNPYLRVLDNIGFLLQEEIKVAVRLNLDNHNFENLYKLVDELAQRFSGNEYINVYVHLLFDNCGFSPVNHNREESEALIKKENELTEYISSKKLMTSKQNVLPCLKISYCKTDNYGSRIINPLGQLLKCDRVLYEHTVGDIENGDTNEEELKYYTEYNEWEDCKSCPFFPKCFIPKTCQTKRSCIKGEIEQQLQVYKNVMHFEYKKFSDNFEKEDK